MIRLGSLALPVARMAELPTMGTTTKIMPGYQISMYWRINGSRSLLAPSMRKTGSIVKSPIRTIAETMSTARARVSVVRRRTVNSSPSPMAREITEEVPTARPMERPAMIITTGKVKLMAASSRVPSWPTKKVSTKLKAIMPSMPTIICMARRVRVDRIGTSTRLAFTVPDIA